MHPILAANAEDLEAARDAGTPEAMLDRLALNPQRVDGIAAGLRQVAGLPDPVGEVLRGRTLANGLQLRQQRVPLGVVGMVYEGRPNVTVDAFGLTFKSGNAALLRGSSSAARSNESLVNVLRAALATENLPSDAVQLLSAADRASVTHLIQARGLVDVVIPRGGAGLIDAAARATRRCRRSKRVLAQLPRVRARGSRSRRRRKGAARTRRPAVPACAMPP